MDAPQRESMVVTGKYLTIFCTLVNESSVIRITQQAQ